MIYEDVGWEWLCGLAIRSRVAKRVSICFVNLTCMGRALAVTIGHVHQPGNSNPWQ